MEHSFPPNWFGGIPFNPLHGKQIDHPHVYLKKSHNSLKRSCD
jgi:hypothetical protein